MEHLEHWEHLEHPPVQREHWEQVGHGHKKRIPNWIPLVIYLLTYLNYLAIVVSAAGATVESTVTAVVSTATAVESVVASVEALPPQATNEVAITNAKITFFIFFVLYLFNCLPIKVTGISSV
jgi:Flp pilus assembly protein protease CpaA